MTKATKGKETKATTTTSTATTATTATTVAGKVKLMRAAIQALKEKQPKGARPRVIWTEAQVKQLSNFITECALEGITIGTMLTNYADFVAPHFEGKSKGAFELKAREVVKAERAAKVVADAAEAAEAEAAAALEPAVADEAKQA